MNKKKKIILIIIGLFVLCITGFAFWQAENIKAVINSFNYTEDEINQMIINNKKELEEKLKENYDIVSDFTEEEERKIMTGEITVEEATAMKLQELEQKRMEKENSSSETKGKSDSEKNSTGTISPASKDSSKTSGQTSSGSSKQPSASNSASKQKAEQIVSNRIVEFYSLKAYYLGQLGQLEARVIAEYSSFPVSKRNMIGKQELANKYMSIATSLMNQCDAKVASLTAQLESEIRAVGGDTSIIGTIKSAYENEKNLKKSYYLSKMK